MGAGQRDDHYIQDAAEVYWVYIVQKELDSRGLTHLGTVEERETEFNEYCSERDIVELFNESKYKKNMDCALKIFVDKLVDKYPDKKMDVIDVETDYRNKGLKADFVISFNDDTPDKPLSLKNYIKGWSSIQLSSGTFHSFANSFLLDKEGGPGKYKHSETNEIYHAQNNPEKRNSDYLHRGYDPSIIDKMNELDDLLKLVKDLFLHNPDTRIFNNQLWKAKCKELGELGISIVCDMLSNMDNMILKQKFCEKADLCHKEDLLLIGPNGDMMCSLFNETYKNLLQRCMNERSVFSYKKHCKNLRMILSDEEGEIIHIDIPFTLQKNGAWYLPKQRYEGSILHQKEGVQLEYGERRPKKSKELNTSTNTWFRIKRYL